MNKIVIYFRSKYLYTNFIERRKTMEKERQRNEKEIIKPINSVNYDQDNAFVSFDITWCDIPFLCDGDTCASCPSVCKKD